jgi:hypothetical protein
VEEEVEEKRSVVEETATEVEAGKKMAGGCWDPRAA